MSSASKSGISARIASRERPASRRSSTSVTRMRMPRTQGRPPHCCGFVVMRFKVSTGPILARPKFTSRQRSGSSRRCCYPTGAMPAWHRIVVSVRAPVALHRSALCRHHTIGRRSGRVCRARWRGGPSVNGPAIATRRARWGASRPIACSTLVAIPDAARTIAAFDGNARRCSASAPWTRYFRHLETAQLAHLGSSGVHVQCAVFRARGSLANGLRTY